MDETKSIIVLDVERECHVAWPGRGCLAENFYSGDMVFPCTAKKKCRKFEANIPRKGISGPQSQFPHSCVCERIIYSHDGAAVSALGNMSTDLGIYKSLTDT